MAKQQAKQPIKIFKLAEKYILEQVTNGGGGKQKANRVVNALIEELDKAIQPPQPFMEMLSDAALRFILRPILLGLVKEAFDGLAERGAL